MGDGKFILMLKFSTAVECRGFLYFSSICVHLCTQPLTGLNMFLVICVLTPSVNFEIFHRPSTSDLLLVDLSSITVTSVMIDDRNIVKAVFITVFMPI